MYDYAPSAAFLDLDRTLQRGSVNFPLALSRAGRAQDRVGNQVIAIGSTVYQVISAAREQLAQALAALAGTAQDLAKRSDPSSGL